MFLVLRFYPKKFRAVEICCSVSLSNHKPLLRFIIISLTRFVQSCNKRKKMCKVEYTLLFFSESHGLVCLIAH